jgi:hypothetical protein
LQQSNGKNPYKWRLERPPTWPPLANWNSDLKPCNGAYWGIPAVLEANWILPLITPTHTLNAPTSSVEPETRNFIIFF